MQATNKMTAKFNLDTFSGVANFEQYARGIARDAWNTTWFNKVDVTATEMWEYEMFQAEQQGDAWGYDENDLALALANDMDTARAIYVRIADEVLQNA